MADDNAQDRNLPASQKKLKKAKQEGQVARSRDFGHFLTLAIGGGLLVAIAPLLVHWAQKIVVQGLHFDAQMLAAPGVIGVRLAQQTGQMLLLVVPLGLAMGLAAVVAACIAGGWNFTLKPVMPNFGKLNPIAGVGRLFTWHQTGEALKAVLLALVLGLVGTLVLKQRLTTYVSIMSVPLPAAIQYAGELLAAGMTILILTLACFAAIDLPLQRFTHAQRLRMSHQEVKQEFRDAEGNVEVKGKIKAKMREMVRSRMMANVPNADLVVMNPTHYAVALKYDDKTMRAPRVVAKGADLLALRIRDLAKEARVPVLQQPMLARALYAHAEIEAEIPAALFAAVAQVLAYVYQLRNAMSGAVPYPDMPNCDVPVELDPHYGKSMGD